MFASYLCCVTPARIFQIADGNWHELHVAATVDVPDDQAVDAEGLIAAWLADAATDGILASLHTREEWRAVDPPLSELDQLHARIRARHADGLSRATFTYPQLFIEFVLAGIKLLRRGGMIIFNDYGVATRDPARLARMPMPRFYGNSLNYEVDFTLFDAVAAVAELRMIRTHDPLRSSHTALFSPGELSAATREAFEAAHGRPRGGQDVLDFSASARLHLANGDPATAIRFLHRCLELDPYNAQLYYRLGEACFEAKLYEPAREALHRGQRLDGWHAHDFEFQLGRAAAALGEHTRAIEHYRRSLAHEPHPVTYANLGSVHELAGDLPDALRSYQRALAFGPDDTLTARIAALRDRWWHAVVAQVAVND